MKIALCLSGQPRFYAGAAYASLRAAVIDQYDTDTFFHAWFKEGYLCPVAPWSNIQAPIVLNPVVLAELPALYTPALYLFEEPRDFPKYAGASYLSRNLPSMLYSLYVADRLRAEHQQSTGLRYDFVIRARFDTLLHGLPELSSLPKGRVYVPDNCPNPLVVNDTFSICDGDLADAVYGIYPVLDDYLSLGFGAEETWTAHLNRLGVRVVKLDFEQSLVRGWERYPGIVLVPLRRRSRGAAETVLHGLREIEGIGGRTVLLDGDTFYGEDILGRYRREEHNAVLHFDDSQSDPIYSYVDLDAAGFVIDIREKLRISTHASSGAYCFLEAHLLARYCQRLLDDSSWTDREPYVSHVIASMLEDGHRFVGLETGAAHCLGTPLQVRLYCQLQPPAAPSRFCFELDALCAGTRTKPRPVAQAIAMCEHRHGCYELIRS